MFFQENGQYRCAVYLRLSRSDGDQQESNSIKNQRALLNDYLGKHPELHKVDEYVDDGYSGTNFERPDFKRMMQDIENRKINCIIVKDLSRFGRNYIKQDVIWKESFHLWESGSSPSTIIMTVRKKTMIGTYPDSVQQSYQRYLLP